MSLYYPTLTLKRTLERIEQGTTPVIAIKEHIDAWNQYRAAWLFEDTPDFVTHSELQWVNAWAAGAAEFEAALIDAQAPQWTECAQCTLHKTYIAGFGVDSRMLSIMETAAPWRRRRLFFGPSGLK